MIPHPFRTSIAPCSPSALHQGVHGIDVVASATDGGMRVARTTFLAVDVR